MRSRYVWRKGSDGKPRMVEVTADYQPASRASKQRKAGPIVLSDHEPYRSPRTGEVIDGKAARREHMRRYGLVEVGNERLQRREVAPVRSVAEDLKVAAAKAGW